MGIKLVFDQKQNNHYYSNKALLILIIIIITFIYCDHYVARLLY